MVVKVSAQKVLIQVFYIVVLLVGQKVFYLKSRPGVFSRRQRSKSMKLFIYMISLLFPALGIGT